MQDILYNQLGWFEKLRQQKIIKSFSVVSSTISFPEMPDLSFRSSANCHNFSECNSLTREREKQLPIIITQTDGEWWALLRADDLLELIKSSKYLKRAICPDCHSTNLRKHGMDYKGSQIFLCLNQNCSRTSFTFKN